MKLKFILILIILTSLASYCRAQRTKATITKTDSTIWINADIRYKHRIIGYSQPDTNSEKKIIFSGYPEEVEGNPMNLPYGAYQETSNMQGIHLKYISVDKNFIKASVQKKNSPAETIYFLRRWLELD